MRKACVALKYDYLGYELPWNNIRFPAQAFVTLKRCEVQAKSKALQTYKSQFELAVHTFPSSSKVWHAFVECK